MVKTWKENTDLQKISNKVYPTKGDNEVKQQVTKAKKSTPAKNSKEIVSNILPKSYPKPKI